MAARKRRQYTPEYQAEVVAMIRRGDRSIGQICKDLDLTNSAVRRWLDKDRPKAAAAAGEAPLSKTERAELTTLRREIRTLREEREILKKAAAFFAKESV